MIKEYDNDYELLYLASENDDNALDYIYNKYKGVIDNYVRKYSKLIEGKGLDQSDLYQEGLIGLDSAIKSFSEQKDIKFSTFAFMCIERRMISAVRKANRTKHKPLNESYSLDYNNDDDMPYLQNIISKDENNVESLIESKEFKKELNEFILNELSKQEQLIFDLKMQGYDNISIAKKLNKSYKSITSTVSRIKIKLNKLKDKIN